MTAQITDIFLLDGKRYSLVGLRGSGLFVPSEHGIPTTMIHTACWRGFVATYSITDALRLEEVYLQMTEPDRHRALFGRKPASYDSGLATYKNPSRASANP